MRSSRDSLLHSEPMVTLAGRAAMAWQSSYLQL
jgi:hypothetical protein